jgi:hypothetical protein
MHELYILCPYSKLFALIDALQAECAARADAGVIVLDSGPTKKGAQGFLVLSFPRQVDPSLVAHLDANPDVLDYSLYVVAHPDTDPAVYLSALVEW